jgi:hypothetical protein
MLKLPLHYFLRPEYVVEIFVHEAMYVPVCACLCLFLFRAFFKISTEITKVFTVTSGITHESQRSCWWVSSPAAASINSPSIDPRYTS